MDARLRRGTPLRRTPRIEKKYSGALDKRARGEGQSTAGTSANLPFPNCAPQYALRIEKTCSGVLKEYTQGVSLPADPICKNGKWRDKEE